VSVGRDVKPASTTSSPSEGVSRVKEAVKEILMNATVGSVEDKRGNVTLTRYEKLRNGEVVKEWKVLRCEIRPELRIMDKSRCLDYAINLLFDLNPDKASELMRKFREVNESELELDSLLGDVAEALKQYNIELFIF